MTAELLGIEAGVELERFLIDIEMKYLYTDYRSKRCVYHHWRGEGESLPRSNPAKNETADDPSAVICLTGG